MKNFTRFDFRIWLCVFAALVFSLFAGNLIAEQGLQGAMIVAMMVGGTFFFFSSYRWWWVPIPAFFASGAMLYYGFKLYLHEVGLALCVVPLIAASALNINAVRQRRPALPTIFTVLLGFLILHLGWSVIVARQTGEGGYGNILRVYLGATWGLGFALMFNWSGSTQYLRHALGWLFVAYLFRVVLTLFTYFVPSFSYIPFINLVLPGSTLAQIDDLRTSAIGLASLSLCYASMTRNRLVRAVHFFLVIGSFFALLLGGGRVAAVVFLGLPTMLALVNRKFGLVIATAAVTVCGVGLLNVNPRMLESLEPRMQRTLGILVLESGGIRAHELTEGSDQWHMRLRELAVERWTSSPWTFVFGNRIKKYAGGSVAMGMGEFDFESGLNQAGDLSSYESAWFSVLASTGVMGAVLFSMVVLFLLKNSYAYLREHRVRDPAGAFNFLAFYNIIIWFALGWAVGGFPSFEILLGSVAFIAARTVQSESVPEAVEADPGLLPVRRLSVAGS